jgi:tyrosyl-tRNA synthetase
LCRTLQQQGHELDLVLGTLTARLGDPSGRDATRPLLSDEEVQANAARLLGMCDRLLAPGFRVHWNHRFVEGMSVPEFLTGLASRVTVSSMLARDGFRRRLDAGDPIALHELLVPLLQGWDSVVLDAEVEVGGTDQLFNFQVARRLQAARGRPPQVVLMMPIIRGTDGRKMSKSLGNTIWLDEAPEQMFGQILSVSDEVMDEWWEVLCDSPHRPAHPMERKKVLAGDIVRQLHGPEAAARARAHFERVVVDREVPDDLPEVERTDLVTLVAAARQESRSRARRLIEGGGVRVDDQQIRDVECVPASGAVVRVGRRRFVRVR